MAPVLTGLLTSAMVSIAKDKLASAITDRAKLLWNFDDDLEDMMAVLDSISAALQDAERRSVQEKLVELWLKRLKNAALDITDMLEDYEDTSEKLNAKVAGVLSCIPIARKKIDVASRMKTITEELRKINKEFSDFHFIPGCGCTTTSVEEPDDVRETSSRLPNKPIIGRNMEKQEVINLLCAGTNNQETSIVAIYGLGGMGKSTLAQQIYNDLHFKKYDHRIWVYVSQNFSLRKIGNSIISLLPAIEGGQQNRDTLEAINQCLDTQLHGKKFIIVLDDLWEDKDTELEKLRSMLHVGKKGSMIDVIVTTRNQDTARKLSTGEAYMLQPLKDDTCWEIIKRTSKFEDKHNQERLKEIGLDIAKKCGGVPLAAQAVGYLLQFKQLSGWTEINNSDIWNEYSKDGGVLPSLNLSYEWMPPQLKICFSFCAIFQKGHIFVEDDLIHQWIALDFIKPSTGKEYIRKLLGMSFLQVSKFPSASREVRYTMHDLVHDLATLIMSDELMASNVASKSNKLHGHKYCRYAMVTKYDKAIKLSNILPSKLRAIHFSGSDKLDLASGAFSFAKCLRILDFSGCSTTQLPASIGNLKQLKYLLAPRMQNEVVPRYITDLTNLQYLNLKASFRISALPESIGKLGRCLKYLGLSSCSGISKLPESFGDLKCMMYLDMSGCYMIRKLPDSLGNLTSLQKLDLSNCCSLKTIPESMSGLTELQYLNLRYCKHIAALPEGIGSLVNLEFLDMAWCRFRELPESFKRLRNLLHLDLECTRIEKGLPGALSGLTSLQFLDMSWLLKAENLEKDELPEAMRNLTNLNFLDLAASLKGYFDVENNDGYLDFIGYLTNLESLNLSANKVLKYLPESIGNFKRLHTLNLEGCSGLKSLPETICGATELKSVLVDRCSDEVIEQASSLLHYSLTLPFFKVRADGVSGRSNLHQLHDESHVGKLNIVSLENVRFLEEAQGLKLSTKQNLANLELSWTQDAHRLVEDKDLLGELVPPMSLQSFWLNYYSSPSFPSWLMAISHHLPNLTEIVLFGLTTCSNLPPLGQLPCLEFLLLESSPSVSKIDRGICGGRGAFRRLKEFILSKMDGLEEWNTTYPGEDGVEEFMFPVLKICKVFLCPRMRLKPYPPKCHEITIGHSQQVISSLEEVETSSHYFCNSNGTTSLTIQVSDQKNLRLFHHFPALNKLVLSQCPNLTSMPKDIQQLSSLEHLEFYKCDSISALPEWLSNFSCLKKLGIYGCTGIKSLPQCIQQLTNLQMLVIHENLELQQWCESEENKAKLARINDIIYGED